MNKLKEFGALACFMINKQKITCKNRRANQTDK